MNHRVSVLITAHDAAPTIGATLRALAEQRMPRDVSMDVIVVDDRSSDDTTRAASEAGASIALRLTVLRLATHSSMRCTARQTALDAGLAHTDAPFVLLLDADATPSPTWVQTMLTFLARADIVSSPIRFVARRDSFSQRAIAAMQSADSAYYRAIARGVALAARPTGICFGGAGVRRSALESIGSFSALGFSLAEDLTFARAAHQRGLSIGFARGGVVAVESAPSWRALRERALRVSAVGGPSVLAAALAFPVATLPFCAALALFDVIPWWMVGLRWALGAGFMFWVMGANASRRMWPAALFYEWCAVIAAIVVALDAQREHRVSWGGIDYARGAAPASTRMRVGQ